MSLGSGKSTYLKQIAIITIMAHCGSYVTADSAKIPIRDRVCCRIGNADDQEHNISTFMLEMRETAFICNNATSRSLILVDELGRATSNEDGVAIAWSVSEYLLKKQVMTFFVTHYPQLSTLAHIYPSVQNIHLEASVSRGNGGEVRYTHKAKLGACKVSTDYGVELAASCGWPEDIVNVARSTQEQVKALLPDEGLCSLDDVSNVRTKAYEELVNVCHHLQSLITDEQVHSYSSIKASLHRLQIRRNSNADSENFRAAMDHLLGREVHTNREIVSSDDFLFNQRQHNDTRTYTEESLEGEVADTFNSPSIWDDGMNRVSASVDMNDGTRSSGSGRKDDDDDGNSSTSLESDDESVSTDSSQSASE